MRGVKLLIVLLFLITAGYYVYFSNSSMDKKIVSNDEGIRVETPDSQWEFDSQERLEKSGTIVKISSDMEGPFKVFSNSVSLALGDVAAELSNKSRDDSLSPEAKRVISEYGCAANYLNRNTASLMTIPSDQDVAQDLESLQKGDTVSFYGQEVNVSSAQYKGNSIDQQMKKMNSKQNIVLIKNVNIQ